MPIFKKISVQYPVFLKRLEKEEHTKSKASGKKEIMIRAEINEIV